MQRSLEASLATIKDSTDLLKAEIAKEEALLANDKQELQTMDKNAKRAEAERKRLMKNVRGFLIELGLLLLIQIALRNTLCSGSWTSFPKTPGLLDLH